VVGDDRLHVARAKLVADRRLAHAATSSGLGLIVAAGVGSAVTRSSPA
jgi:hypothetical protein